MLCFYVDFSRKLMATDLLGAFRPAYNYAAGKWVDQGSWIRFFHLPVNLVEGFVAVEAMGTHRCSHSGRPWHLASHIKRKT